MIILDEVLPPTVFNRLIELTVDNHNFRFGCVPTTLAVTLVTLHTSGAVTLQDALTVWFIVKLGLVISVRPVASSGVMLTAISLCD